MAQGTVLRERLLAAKRRCKCAFDRPMLFVESRSQRADGNACEFGPLSQRVRLAGMVDLFGRTQRRACRVFGGPSTMDPLSILQGGHTVRLGMKTGADTIATDLNISDVSFGLCLLKWCFPLDVLRRVIAVIIGATDRVPLTRAVSNVGQKLRKVISPLRAHANTSAAVIFIGLCVRVVTALFHSSPNAIFGRLAQSMRLISQTRDFRPHAAATLAGALQQTASKHISLRSALATAPPITWAGHRRSQRSPSCIARPTDDRHIVRIITGNTSMYTTPGGALSLRAL